MYESKIKSEAMDRLFAAVARLENEEECYRFFEDLCTINELQAMAQRYEVARMLKKGDTYIAVAEKTGASSGSWQREKKPRGHILRGVQSEEKSGRSCLKRWKKGFSPATAKTISRSTPPAERNC